MIESLLYKAVGFHRGIPVKKLKSKYSTPESKFISVEDMNVHYRITGQGDAVFLIHGIGSSLHTWKDYHKILSDDFTVISLDIPGFGLTGPTSNQQYSFDIYVNVFEAILKKHSFEKAHFVGNSLGGLLAWQFTIRKPKMVDHLVLMDAAGMVTTYNELTDFGFKLAANNYTKKITYKVLPKSLVATSLKNAVYNPEVISKRKVEQYVELLLRQGNREAFSHILRNLILSGKDHIQIIKTIKHPTLIMWGEEDNIINVNDAFLFKRAIPHAELIIYPKIGHLPMEENPKESATHIKQFIEGKLEANEQ